jgi:inhibitor of KinA sporulation pathway (predicted exonuclease)
MSEAGKESLRPPRFVVVDLEATCWEGPKKLAANETIEIGSVCYEIDIGIIDEFQSFVRPTESLVLSDFCKELTHIQQEDVDGAPSFPEALEKFHRWAEGHAPYILDAPYILAAWGAYDQKQLREDCARNGVRYPFGGGGRYVNLKQAFANIRNVRPCGMSMALRQCQLPLLGTHHRGIDDAHNIARLLEHLLEKVPVNRLLEAGR